MAALNFPDPNTTQTYTEAGITWTWNATLGVWSTDANDGFTENIADDLYLSKVNDDTAAGEITFEKQSTHEGGTSVTGGGLMVTCDADTLPVNGRVTQSTYRNTAPQAIGIAYNAGFGAGTQVTDFLAGYNVGDFDGGAANYGFKSSLNEGDNNYAFYAKSGVGNQTAKSLFGGHTIHEGGVSVTGGTRDPDVTSTTYPKIWSENNGYALYFKNRGLSPEAPGVEFLLRKPDDAGGGCHILNDNNTDGTQKAALFIAGAWAGDYTGTGGSSIYKNAYLRVTANIQSSTTDASNPVLGVQSGSRVGPGNHWRCFHASRPTVGDVATEYIGYYTGINNDCS